MIKRKINKVWLRASALFFLIVFLLTFISTFVGVYFGSKIIVSTVEQDLNFFSRITSNMLESSINRLITDCDYVSNKLNKAYVEGFGYVNKQGTNIVLPPGRNALYAAAAEESDIGAAYFHLACLIPEYDEKGRPVINGGTWVEAVKKPHLDKVEEQKNYEFAKLDKSRTEEYKSMAIPFNREDSRGSIVFGIPDITTDGQVLLRAYVYRESGLFVVLSFSGNSYSDFVNAKDFQLYGEGRILLIDGSGYIFIATDIGLSEYALKPGQFYKENDPNFTMDLIFWNFAKQSIENGHQYRKGDIKKKKIEFLEFKAADGNNVFLTSVPVVAGNTALSFVTTVVVSATPIADIRSIFYSFSSGFLIVGFIASIFFGFMQSRPYEQILKLKNAAEEVSQVKSDFLSNMSHEIRTPLNAVIGMAEIAHKATELSRKDYCISKIKDASQHLMGVISDILDMSKIEAGKLELDIEPISPLEMLERIKDVFFFRCQEKNIEFSITLENIPEYINSDGQRISQVIANLVSNAIKFTPNSGTVSLIARKIGETDEEGFVSLEFIVKDTGIGISEEGQTKIFQSFQQADKSISKKYGGTGLGLAISKRIVNILGGDIFVKSQLEQGSEFSFIIRAQLADPSKTIDTKTEGIETFDFKSKTLLLVEDININREIVLAFLEPSGIRIIEAENGEEAVDIFEKNASEIDIILMDIQMPVMSGYEATQKIRSLSIAKAETVPIIAMTANVFKEDIDKCFEVGMNGHLGKPIDVVEVLEHFKKYLG